MSSRQTLPSQGGQAQGTVQGKPPSQNIFHPQRRRRIRDLLRHIPTFAFRFVRLMAFVIFLLPAFVVFIWHYVTCDRVAVYYGDLSACGGRCKTPQNKSDKAANSNGHYRAAKPVSELNSGQKCRSPIFSRHYLDIYGSKTICAKRIDANSGSPENNCASNKKPVVIFLTGGAWIIGYRMWGTLLGRALAPFGLLVIVPDYRNFPAVNISQMVDDVDKSIDWAFNNVEGYGGDREKIILVGQSAGAHIGGVVVARKVWDCIREKKLELGHNVQNCKHCRDEEMDLSPLSSAYQPFKLRGFISTSAPHNLVTMREVFHRHGLSSSVQQSIFGGGEGHCQEQIIYNGKTKDANNEVFEKWSPYHIVERCHLSYLELEKILQQQKSGDGMINGSVDLRKCDPDALKVSLEDIFPKMCVIHGTSDKTVPIKEAIEFISLLNKLDIPVKTKLYNGWSHTDPILEAPMRGNHLYHGDIYELVRLWAYGIDGIDNDDCSRQKSCNLPYFDQNHPKLRSICPWILVEVARFCNPF